MLGGTAHETVQALLQGEHPGRLGRGRHEGEQQGGRKEGARWRWRGGGRASGHGVGAVASCNSFSSCQIALWPAG